MFSYFDKYKPFNFKSIYSDLSNQSINWLSTDTEENYNANLSVKYKKENIIKNNLSNTSFNYSFNSYGFRCNEFVLNNSIMFLGCSITLGVGLPFDLTWPAIVSKSLGLECANLGQAGGTPDTAFRMCLGYIDIVKPKILVYLNPPPMRFELVNKKQSHFLGPWSYGDQSKMYRQWSVDYNNHYFNVQKNLLAIKMLCTDRNIQFIPISSDIHYQPIDYARDFLHPGILTNKKIANFVIEQISK